MSLRVSSNTFDADDLYFLTGLGRVFFVFGFAQDKTSRPIVTSQIASQFVNEAKHMSKAFGPAQDAV